MTAGAPLDARGDRAAQGAIGVVLLAGFVFHLPWVVPVVGLLIVGGALTGPGGDGFERLFATVLVARLKPAEATVAPETVRAQDAVLAGLCLLATLAFFVFTLLGWLITIAAAVVAIVAASTGVHLGEWAIHRLFSR